MLLPIFPQLNRVDNVLPKDIATGSDWRHRIEIGVGDPDGEGGVLLERGLTRVDLVAQMTAYAATDEEEYEAENKTEQSYHEQQGQTSIAMDDITDGDAWGDAELGCQDIKRQIGDGDDLLTEALGIMLHKPA